MENAPGMGQNGTESRAMGEADGGDGDNGPEGELMKSAAELLSEWKGQSRIVDDDDLAFVRHIQADAAADMRERAAAKAAAFTDAASYPCEYGETHVFGEDVAKAIRALPLEAVTMVKPGDVLPFEIGGVVKLGDEVINLPPTKVK
jgi:hypothetical protein